jgi:hypothetical protein
MLIAIKPALISLALYNALMLIDKILLKLHIIYTRTGQVYQ